MQQALMEPHSSSGSHFTVIFILEQKKWYVFTVCLYIIMSVSWHQLQDIHLLTHVDMLPCTERKEKMESKLEGRE